MFAMLPEYRLQCRFVTIILGIHNKPQRTVFSIDFEWWRDDAGYRYVPAAPGNPEPSEMSALYEMIAPIMGRAAKPARIVRRGGKLLPYHPFDKVDGLYKIFAQLGTTGEELLDFVNRFGPLTEEGNRDLWRRSIVCVFSCPDDARSTFLS